MKQGRNGKSVRDHLRRVRKKFDERKAEQADNRRKLLARLDPETAEMTRRDFAKLGLFQ